MTGRILSLLAIGTFLLAPMGCGTEYDAELYQPVGQSESEMRENTEFNPNRLIAKWNQLIDCNDPGMKSCHECGAGEDGVFCCFRPPCKVVNKPKPTSSAMSEAALGQTQAEQ